jgi:predicted ArsR family transcriptional regulator
MPHRGATAAFVNLPVWEQATMIQETQDSLSQLQPEQWRSRVGYFLRQRAVVRAGEIAEWLGVGENVVRHCLAEFERTGVAEVLRPVGRAPGTLPDLDYYRWRQADDTRYRWQAELYRPRVDTLRELRSVLQEAGG